MYNDTYNVVYRGLGVVILTLSWLITLFTLWQMVEMHEMVPGKRFDRYHELGQHAFGEKLGLYIVVPQQLVVQVGACITYCITRGKSMEKVQNILCNNNCSPLDPHGGLSSLVPSTSYLFTSRISTPCPSSLSLLVSCLLCTQPFLRSFH